MRKLIYFVLSLIFSYSNIISQSAWETLAPLQNPPSLATMASANGKIYLLSGSGTAAGAQTSTYEYDPASNSWTKKAKIPQACYWATANEVDGKIYVMGGGHPYPGKRYNFIYDAISDSWSSGDSLLSPRMYHSSAALDGKIYLIGAQNGDAVQYYFDEYDTKTNVWTRKENNLHNMAWYCTLAPLGKKIYRIGGGGAPNNVTQYFESFDTESGVWSLLPDMKSKFHASTAVTYNNRIYLIGGNSNGKDIDSVYAFYPEIEEWVPELFNMPQARVYHRAVLCNDCIYVYGGQNTQQDPISGSLIRYCFKETKVNDNQNEKTSIFPNPSNGSFYIQDNRFASKILDIQLTDMLGRQVESKIKNINENQSFIELTTPAKGLYLLKLITANSIEINKIIVE